MIIVSARNEKYQNVKLAIQLLNTATFDDNTNLKILQLNNMYNEWMFTIKTNYPDYFDVKLLFI